MKTLADIHAFWHKHNTCSLKATATQPVFGDGNSHADIVFIGEAPGKEEDLTGIPFVGRAGKILNELLEEIKLHRKDIYITNTVKYRPPNNRDPELSEKESCKAWLYAELNFIKPKLIIFLGRHSLNTYFPKEKISLVHGKLLHTKIVGLDTEYFLALYHPAAALYNSTLRKILSTDFKQIPKILKKITRTSADIKTTKRLLY